MLQMKLKHSVSLHDSPSIQKKKSQSIQICAYLNLELELYSDLV